MSLAQSLKTKASELGFCQTGIVKVSEAISHDRYLSWLKAGLAGEMSYLSRHAPLKKHPSSLLPTAISMLVCTWNYNTELSEASWEVPQGRISRYAQGRDYHNIIRERLDTLGNWVATQVAKPLDWHPFVDAAPVLEREFAARAGLGWIGKHTNLIHWKHGSWLFISGLLLSIPLDYDLPEPAGPTRKPGLQNQTPNKNTKHPPAELLYKDWPIPTLNLKESCGSCTACINACPTQAITAPRVVDGRRCISYLTIEKKTVIPREFRVSIGDWLFGCDICQEVCPWNRKAPQPGINADLGDGAGGALNLLDVLRLDDLRFGQRFRDTPLFRTKRRGLLRNAAIVLGNLLRAIPAEASSTYREQGLNSLEKALHDPEPLIRGAAAWALGEAGGVEAARWLSEKLQEEEHPEVREELTAALTQVHIHS